MAPLGHRSVADVKDTWDVLKEIMDWFTKIVTTGYEYSDGIIASRQNDVDNEYAQRQAARQAKKIMLEQLRNRTAAAGKKVTRRNIIWSGGRRSARGW